VIASGETNVQIRAIAEGMIEKFDLLNANIYRKIPRTFFLDDYRWEKTDMVKDLLKAAK